MMNLITKKVETLPVTKDTDIRKWSYLYAFNIRTIRDIFVYCAIHGKIDEEKIYNDMEKKIIPPPKERWINVRKKRKERLRLEYLHATEYLGFIKKEKGKFHPDLERYRKDKELIIFENKDRIFSPQNPSPSFSENEKKSFLSKIILDYKRANDFLRWFLDFSKYPANKKFSIKEFKKNAEPIQILGKIEKGEKGSKIVKREIDGKIWIIPEKYIRLASYVFPNWFFELGLINKVVVFPEFSNDKKLWHMFYPIKTTTQKFLNTNMSDLLMKHYMNDKKRESTVWIPHLIYTIARNYYVPVEAIKRGLIKVHKSDPSSFYLERIPTHLMKSRLKYRESYLEINGFFRSHLKITRG